MIYLTITVHKQHKKIKLLEELDEVNKELDEINKELNEVNNKIIQEYKLLLSVKQKKIEELESIQAPK